MAKIKRREGETLREYRERLKTKRKAVKIHKRGRISREWVEVKTEISERRKNGK